jgi:hypothetical protein
MTDVSGIGVVHLYQVLDSLIYRDYKLQLIRMEKHISDKQNLLKTVMNSCKILA